MTTAITDSRTAEMTGAALDGTATRTLVATKSTGDLVAILNRCDKHTRALNQEICRDSRKLDPSVLAVQIALELDSRGVTGL